MNNNNKDYIIPVKLDIDTKLVKTIYDDNIVFLDKRDKAWQNIMLITNWVWNIRLTILNDINLIKVMYEE
jgi:hypothetical protein